MSGLMAWDLTPLLCLTREKEALVLPEPGWLSPLQNPCAGREAGEGD